MSSDSSDKTALIEGNVVSFKPSPVLSSKEFVTSIDIKDIDLDEIEDLLFKLNHHKLLHPDEQSKVARDLEAALLQFGLSKQLSEDREACILILKSIKEEASKLSEAPIIDLDDESKKN